MSASNPQQMTAADVASDMSDMSDMSEMGLSSAHTVSEAAAAARARLAAAGVPTPAVDARLLLLHVLQWRPDDLVIRSGQVLSDDQRVAFAAAVRRRCDRVPLQHITGAVGFRHVDLHVRPGVFIPRQETESLVDLVLPCVPEGGTVVEPCTGSGAVAAAIAGERPDVRVVATDIDPAAVALARRNTATYAERAEVLRGDLLQPVDPSLCGRVDVLVANPPYLAEDELAGLEPEVVRGDPRGALVAGPTGHEVSDRLIDLATRWLAPGGALVLELDARRVADAARRCTAAGLAGAQQLPDLTGTPRFVRAFRGGP